MMDALKDAFAAYLDSVEARLAALEGRAGGDPLALERIAALEGKVTFVEGTLLDVTSKVSELEADTIKLEAFDDQIKAL
jgi:hypothetical protein